MELDGLPSTIMPLPAVTLTFDLLAQSEHVCPGPRYSYFGEISSNIYEYIVLNPDFRLISCGDLHPLTFDPKS